MLDAKRPVAIVGMLFASIVLIGVLGWHSWRLQQSNVASAESVLREYAILVADEFGRRLIMTIGYRGYFQLISRFDNPPSANEMRDAVAKDNQLGDAAKLAAGFFVFDGNELTTAQIDQTPEFETLLRQIHGNSATEEEPYHSIRTSTGGRQFIYAIATASDGSRRISGFEVDLSGVKLMMQGAFDLGPLLPPSLADGRVSNDVLFTEVKDPGGKILFEANRQYYSHLSMSKVIGDDYQGILEGFTIRVSVDPESASSLVIGGLPESRLPLLLTVMIMTVVLMLTAIWLFRREQAVMKLRSDFVSQVSHELRTPLTQIRMFAETLLLGRTRTDDEHQRSLEIIDRESRRLSYLVDNILLFSNISDALLADCHWQALAPIVREVCDSMQATANEAVIRLSADETVHATVDADALRQIVLNLIDNAIKYGPQQQDIRVALTGIGNVAQISIADQGPGIPQAERERVWTAFYRLKREQTTAISGTGIGLSVVRELVEAMGGRCWIDAPNGGARVNIEFHPGEGNG